eukprot:1945857-Prymnesium_polylepis.1
MAIVSSAGPQRLAPVRRAMKQDIDAQLAVCDDGNPGLSRPRPDPSGLRQKASSDEWPRTVAAAFTPCLRVLMQSCENANSSRIRLPSPNVSRTTCHSVAAARSACAAAESGPSRISWRA